MSDFLDNNEEDVEKEDQGSSVISMPFDPNMIKVRRDPFTLGQLVDKIENNEVRFDTPYQRKDNLWDSGKQSRFIESILLKLPLPAFYFDEYDENKQLWNVIDGLQRCSVIKNFIIDSSLKLVDLEFLNAQYGDFYYNQLPRDLQRRIQQTPITVHIIEFGTPDIVKFNIFKRINTGGLVLTPQEIRHAMNQGLPNDLVSELADSDEFQNATDYKIKKERLEDQDFITRFISFYLQDYHDYNPDLDSFMLKGMGLIKKLNPTRIDELKNNFKESMQTIQTIFGNDAFRKRLDPYERRKPINKALFEVESVVIAKLKDWQRQKLKDLSNDFRLGFIELNNNLIFFSSLTSATGVKDNVIKRFSLFEKLVNEILNKK